MTLKWWGSYQGLNPLHPTALISKTDDYTTAPKHLQYNTITHGICYERIFTSSSSSVDESEVSLLSPFSLAAESFLSDFPGAIFGFFAMDSSC